jgi:LysM domain-containing protein
MIKQGETYPNIAKEFNVTVDDIKDWVRGDPNDPSVCPVCALPLGHNLSLSTHMDRRTYHADCLDKKLLRGKYALRDPILG